MENKMDVFHAPFGRRASACAPKRQAPLPCLRRLRGDLPPSSHTISIHKDLPMTRMLSTLAMTVALSASAIVAAQADALTIMKGNSDCQKQYGACLSGGSDMKMGMNAAENATKFQANMANANQCREALQACFETVRVPREFIAD
jgi:hypothetical protein